VWRSTVQKFGSGGSGFDPSFDETEKVRVVGVDEIRQCSRMKRWRMEWMLRVHRVKFAGPGFSSMSRERRKKARRSGLRKRSARWRAKSRKTADWVGTPWESVGKP